jgi:alpha-tubulin suppressor-like RCC1 family protein
MDGVAKTSSFAGHALILKRDGSVYSRGFNDYGELGIGTTGTGDYVDQPVKIADVK